MIKKIKHLSKSVKVIIFLLVLISSAYAASWVLGYGQNNNSDGLVLDLTLSEENYNAATKTFSDQSGNNNNGVSFNNATFSVDKDGKSAGAMSFNGSSDYVNCGNNITDLALGGNSFAMGAWARVNQLSTSYNYIVSFGYPSSGHQAGFGVRNTGNLFLSAYSSPIVNTSYTVADVYDWHYYFMTYEDASNQVRFYVDGVLREIEVIDLDTLIGRCRVGSHVGDASFFNGEITEVKIFNRYFEADEVSELYNDYKPKLQASSLEKGLVGYWPLDGENYNSNTNRVTDKSAYSNHGTNNGATLTEDRFGRSEGAMQFGSSKFIRIIGDKIQSGSWAYPEASFVMWVKPNSAAGTGDQNIITIENSFEIALNNRQNGFSSVKYASNPWAWKSNYSNNIKNDEWSQIVYTHTYDSRRVYVNGNLLFSFNDIGNLSAGGGPYPYFTIGGRYSGTRSPFMGNISEVRVYDRVLNVDEIISLYEKDAPKISSSSLKKGLVLDMPLTSQYTKGGAVGSEVLVDNSPYTHNGQNYGGVVGEEGTFLSDTGDRVVTDFQVPNNQGTISVWYKPIHGTSDASRKSILYSTGSSWVDNSFELALRSCCGNPYDNVLYMRDSNSSYLRFEWDTPIWNANEWVHILVTYSSQGFIRPYVNGELQVASQAINNGTFNFPDMFVIGGKSSSSVSAKGTVRNMKVYDRVLSLDEIKSLYDQGRGETAIILGGN